MNLESVTQCEVIQNEKKQHLLMYMESKKNGTDGPICWTGREVQTQRTDMGTQWAGEVGVNQEASIDTHT